MSSGERASPRGSSAPMPGDNEGSPLASDGLGATREKRVKKRETAEGPKSAVSEGAVVIGDNVEGVKDSTEGTAAGEAARETEEARECGAEDMGDLGGSTLGLGDVRGEALRS